MRPIGMGALLWTSDLSAEQAGLWATVSPYSHASSEAQTREVAADKLLDLGPMRPGVSQNYHVLKLNPGVYWFSVQAIDSGFEGGPWSEPVPFAVP